jgi:hypothetical protein
MPLFLADISADTELYRVRGDNVVVKGMERLAFELEHAMNFERQFRPRLPEDGRAYLGILEKGLKDRISRLDDLSHDNHAKLRHQHLLEGSGDVNVHDEKDTKPPRGPPADDFEVIPGWMHTYMMKHDLKVIYIEGEAAAKSRKGTLDTQDYLFAPANERHDPGKPGYGPGGKYGRTM